MKKITFGFLCSLVFSHPVAAGVPEEPVAVIISGTEESPPYVKKDGANADDYLYDAMQKWAIAARKKYGTISIEYVNRLLMFADSQKEKTRSSAVAIYKEALEILLRLEGDRSEDACAIANRLCSIYFCRHEYKDAEVTSLAILQKYGNSSCASSAQFDLCLQDALLACYAQRHYAEGISIIQKKNKVHSNKNILSLVTFYSLTGKIDQAKQLYSKNNLLKPNDSSLSFEGLVTSTISKWDRLLALASDSSSKELRCSPEASTLEPDYFIAMRQSEWFAVCLFEGRSHSNLYFYVDKAVGKEFKFLRSTIAITSSDSKAILHNSSGKCGFEKTDHKIGSAWIVFLSDNPNSSQKPYRTVRGCWGIQPATEKNLEQLQRMWGMKYGQH